MSTPKDYPDMKDAQRLGQGQPVVVHTLSPVVHATVESMVQNGDHFTFKLKDIEEHEAGTTASIQIPASSTSPLTATRWWNALAAVWGEARDRSAAGAEVRAADFEGKRVKVQRVKLACADESYTGWDFAPQQSGDVKVKTFLGKVKGATRRFFGGRR